MTRGLSAPLVTAATGEVVARTVAIELDFPSGYVRINGSPVDLTLGDTLFLGVGGLGAVTVVDESSELRAYDLSVSLSGVPRDSVALALTQQYQGRPGTVWEILLDPTTWRPVAEPIRFFRGRMDRLDVTTGETATVSVRMVNRLADWERQRVRRYTDQEQQRRFPGDRGLRFVSATAEKSIEWPGKDFQKNNAALFR